MHHTSPRQCCALRSRKGFTLVEILIVIAIIAILSMILFPVFGRVRESGRATACQSNLKQLGLAFQQYTSDAGGRYPFAANFQSWKPGNGHWVSGECGTDKPLADLAAPYAPTNRSADVEDGALYPYVRSAAVYTCPSSDDAEIKKLSYSMNCAIGGMHTVRMKSPAEIILLVDEDKANDGFFYAWDTSNSTDGLTQKHNDTGNLLFADGHVKAYPFKAFPLNNKPEGLANKSKLTGTPRFHDKAFGPKGTSSGYAADCDGTMKFDVNSCAQQIVP